MSITVVCPACGGKMSAPSQLLGRMAKCPRCAKAIKVVPSTDPPSPPSIYQSASANAGSNDKPDEPAAKGGSALSVRRIGLPVAGSVVGLVVVVIGVMWLGRPGLFLGTAGKQNSLDQVTNASVAQPSPETNNATPPGRFEEKNATWIDASSGPVQHGDVRLQVASVTVRNVRIRDVLNEETVSPTKYLTITLQIDNTSTASRIDFLGWSGGMANRLTLAELSAGAGDSKVKGTDMSSARDANAASLKDNFGKLCEPISPGFGAQIPGQIRTATSVAPGKRLGDLLVFEPPMDEVQFLRLELPAAAFGETGVLRLQIPKGMIRR
jgi:hypothetical protein